MTSDYVVVLTTIIGVSGPVLTLIITNRFQDKQKTKEHNNSLQAIWFTKKLNAAEVIIAQNALFLASIFSINIAIKNLKFGDNEPELQEGEFNVIEHLQNEARKGLEKASQLDTVLSNSLFLYFNVAERESLALQGIIKSFYEAVQGIIPKLRKALATDPGSEERLAYDESLDAFVSKYNELRGAIEGQMKRISGSFEGVK